MAASTIESNARVLLTVKQLAEKHPAFSEGCLRNLIFNAASPIVSGMQGNGLNVAIIRIGRKILIDEARFFDWIEQQQEIM